MKKVSNGRSLMFKINGFALSEQVAQILKKRASLGKPVHIMLSSHNIAYANIIGEDCADAKERFHDLSNKIHRISPESLIMMEGEGGVMQKIRTPLTSILFPSSIAFKSFHSKLISYFTNQNDETILELLRDEIYLFFEMSDIRKIINIKGLIEGYLSYELSAIDKALTITSKLIEIMYETMSINIRKYGIDVLLAPVADFYDGNVGIIQSRSFGTDPMLIAKFCVAALKGIKKSGMKNCIRHFVCQGQAKDLNNRINDARLTPLFYSGSVNDMMKAEGLVFKTIFEEYSDIDYVMLASATLKNIKSSTILDPKPLVLSPEVLIDLFKIIGLPSKTNIVTPDVFNMPIKELISDKHEKILAIKEVFDALKNLDRKSIVLIYHNIEDFEKNNGFEILDGIR